MVAMQIVDVRTAVVRRHYDGESRNTLHSWAGKNYLLVSVETSAGTAGLGEIYCDGHGSTAVAELLIREEIAPAIIGEDPRAIAQIRSKLLAQHVLSGRAGAFGPALAGIDIALWDLLGKLAGQPLYRLLGGFSNRASVYGSGGMYGPAITPTSLAREMGEAVRSGLGGVKIKGCGASLEEDVARVSAVREAIGPDARLMVDAMFAASVPAAIRLARAFEPYNLHFLEAPTATADLRGWQTVRRATSIPLAGPELESSLELMRDFVLADAVHFLQYDVVLACGISAGRDLGALARIFHRPVSLHCAASAVGLAASAHLAASMPNCDSLEYHLMHQGLHERLWSSGWALDAGDIVIPDRPGLGLDFDFDTLVALENAA
jgi:L-alanine-DL-glutamate epimerase-like enolase superfamily enzyme